MYKTNELQLFWGKKKVTYIIKYDFSKKIDKLTSKLTSSNEKLFPTKKKYTLSCLPTSFIPHVRIKYPKRAQPEI